MNKKFLAKLLIFCMMFTMIPMTAFGAAAEGSENTYTVNADASSKTIRVGETATVSVESVTYKVDADTKIVTDEYTPSYAITAGNAFATIEGATVKGVAAGTATVTATVALNGQSYTGTVDIEVVAADAITVKPVAGVANVTLPTTVTVSETATDTGVYSLANDVNVVFNVKSGETSVTAVNVPMNKAVVEAMLGTLTTGKTTVILRSDLGDIALSKTVLDKLNVEDADVVLKVSKENNATTEANGIKAENVKATYEVTFTLNNNPVMPKATVNTNPTVVLTVPNPLAADKTPYAYYLADGKYDKTGISATSVDNGANVAISAKHFSTIVLTDTAVDSGSSNVGGGGSSSNVSIATKVTGGKVTVTPTRPTRGQTVTITVTPADGYKLDSLTVTDLKGNTIELTKVSDTKYTFVMPAGKVKITPVFVKIDGSDKDNTTNVDKRFSDVAADAWYAEYINYVAENGLMNGYEDGRFGPNDKTTRAQIVTVLYRMEGEPAVSSSSSFKDVSAGGQYYSAAVAWASRNDIVNGYEDGRFGPNDNVTREQIAAILYRYAAYKEYDTTLAGNIASFSDAAKVSSWANSAIAWAVGEGLINGDNGALKPQGNATRAEIATLLTRFAKNIAE